MPDELSGKIIMLTGGADGIGYECASAYVREGAVVAVIDRDGEKAERAVASLGCDCMALQADVGEEAAVEAAIQSVLRRFGRLDAVHNNAGIASPSKPLDQTSEHEWDELMRINLKSVFWTTQFSINALIDAQGAILNTASMVGLIGQENHAAYVATKGALIALTKAMALDYAPRKVRVNAICPAAVWTPMLQKWCSEQPEPDRIRQGLEEMHPLGSCPQGDVIADAAVFLLSRRARFVTGCILPVSGGAELGYRRCGDYFMSSCVIRSMVATDARFSLPEGAGSDAVHTSPVYAMALTYLRTENGEPTGVGLALTLGEGNRLVCDAIRILAHSLQGRPIEEVMADFGSVTRRMANDPALRWLGPHKGVVHLALASISNACWDLWAKCRGVPLWKLLLDLDEHALVAALDLSYLEDVLSSEEAVKLLGDARPTRPSRESILQTGYPGYDTSVGWMAYDDDKVRELTLDAMARGFRAFKLKVGSDSEDRDIRRAVMLREAIGDSGILMFDANQRWNSLDAMRMCRALAPCNPLWIEEPTHPDDIHAHVELARAIAPVRIAAGEHMPNRLVFKNYFVYGGVHFVQADCTRLAGVSEFLAVSLMAKKFNLPVVPHVGDMGQIHQHLVLFNHVALNHEMYFLEHIPHLREHFVFPADVTGGRYKTPQEPGASTDMRLEREG